MTTAAIVSVGGAPGVSTLVAAMATTATEAVPLLVVEAAPTGGVVASRWGWRREATLAELAMDSKGVDLWRAGRPWIEGARIVPGDPSAVVTRQAQVGRWLAAVLPTAGPAVVVDAGRVDGSADQLELLAAVDHRWILLEPTIDQTVTARALSPWLHRAGDIGLLVRERTATVGGYPAADVAATLGWPVAATVPHDPAAAAALCGAAPASRDLRRSSLVRAGRDLTGRLQPVGVAS